MKTPSTSLVQVLIVKSTLEVLLVAALAVFAFITILPPSFHGQCQISEAGISGWVVDSAAPWDRVEVQLFVDGRFFAARVANESRRELVTAGSSQDEWHGYTFPITTLSAGRHEARVYAFHRGGDESRKALRAVGDPISFSIAADGKNLQTGAH